MQFPKCKSEIFSLKKFQWRRFIVLRAGNVVERVPSSGWLGTLLEDFRCFVASWLAWFRFHKPRGLALWLRGYSVHNSMKGNLPWSLDYEVLVYERAVGAAAVMTAGFVGEKAQ